tara:strand:- start:29818 stop:30210 length:393 start_codon:yes stop_codon:yes gene_type:complete
MKKFYLNLEKLLKATFSILILSLSSLTHADDNVEKNILYNDLIKEIRCMVCQNQNIAESEAPLAVDLREKVKELIANGKTEEEIKKFMTDRYSSFILYDPPRNRQNIFLWFGPLIFLLLITFFLYRKSAK